MSVLSKVVILYCATRVDTSKTITGTYFLPRLASRCKKFFVRILNANNPETSILNASDFKHESSGSILALCAGPRSPISKSNASLAIVLRTYSDWNSEDAVQFSQLANDYFPSFSFSSK